MKRSNLITLVFLLFAAFALTGCGTPAEEQLAASGTLSALEVPIAPEISGQVVEIMVTEGDIVQEGDPLFRIEDELYQAQYEQALGGLAAAEAGVQAAQAQLTSVQLQYDLTVQAARVGDMQARQSAWSVTLPDDYRPVWYFQDSEMIAASQAEVDAASEALANRQEDLAGELKDASNQDFISAEQRLAQAQVAFSVAEQTQQQADLSGDDLMIETAQDNLDAAQSELDAARMDYDRILTTSAAEAVLTARARVAIEQARYDNARDALLMLQTGEESLQVQAAEAAIRQAEAGIILADANMQQAQAAVALLDLQLDRTLVTAPIDGVVLTRSVEVGEMVAAGGVAMSIGQLETLKLVVYVPETQYGMIDIHQQVNIQVDSFPDLVFTGEVVRIADQAEFTPRNVQTSEGRKSTVYAVEILVLNADLKLKSGMPADATFIED